MQKIGPKTMAATLNAIDDMLATYLGKINHAFDAQENELAVTIKLKYSLGKGGAIALQHGISFVESQIKDSDTVYIDEEQMPLPLGDGIDSVEISSGGRTVTLRKTA